METMSFYSSGMVYTMKINKIYTVLDGDKYCTKIKQKNTTEVKGALQIHRMHKKKRSSSSMLAWHVPGTAKGQCGWIRVEEVK